jgi:chaperonin cofactor prefoldin
MSANSQPPKAVLELSQKLQENATRLKQLDAQKRALETDIRRAVITAHHLNEVKDDTVTYKSVGKAYMRVERAEILDNLEASVKAWDTEAKACKGNMDRLVKVQEGLVKELQEVR